MSTTKCSLCLVTVVSITIENIKLNNSTTIWILRQLHYMTLQRPKFKPFVPGTRYVCSATASFLRPNFQSISPYDKPFSLLVILRQVHRMTAKWPWTLQDKSYPLHVYVLLVHLNPKFHSILRFVLRTVSHFLVPDQSDKYGTKWPPNYFGTYTWSCISYTLYCYPRVLNFNPFHSMISGFRVTDYFETSARNDSKMTLNTTRTM